MVGAQPAMPYVNHELCRNDPDYAPNVSMIRVEGVRLCAGRIPREIRRELLDAVKAGALGHLKRDGLMPEAFFHPNSRAKALDARAREARAGIAAIAAVTVRASDLPVEIADEMVLGRLRANV